MSDTVFSLIGLPRIAGPHPSAIRKTRPRNWLDMVRRWRERSRQRAALGELAELNDHLLNDIGISQDDARREAAKPFWR